jgi:hypothetical protein
MKFSNFAHAILQGLASGECATRLAKSFSAGCRAALIFLARGTGAVPFHTMPLGKSLEVTLAPALKNSSHVVARKEIEPLFSHNAKRSF